MTNGEFVTKDMSNEKHTPGPWRVEKHSQGYNLVRPGATQEYLTVYPEDDARLIAAAPELLAALHECTAALEECIVVADMYTQPHSPAADGALAEWRTVLNTCRAAIAKAEGKDK